MGFGVVRLGSRVEGWRLRVQRERGRERAGERKRGRESGIEKERGRESGREKERTSERERERDRKRGAQVVGLLASHSIATW